MREFKADFSNNYFRVGNNHIFISISSDNLNDINTLKELSNKHIHLFIVDPLYANNLIDYLLDATASTNKVIIHVPYVAKDCAVLLNNRILQHDGNWRIIIERCPVTFARHNDNLVVDYRYNRGDDAFEISVYTELRKLSTPAWFYNLLQTNNIIQNRIQLKNPEVFKSGILRRFKRYADRSGMLEDIRNDQIWEYILENYIDGENTKDEKEEI